jgi:hypothetical protein
MTRFSKASSSRSRVVVPIPSRRIAAQRRIPWRRACGGTWSRDGAKARVKEGTGIRTRADLRRELTEINLLAREGELVLAVHAIDRAALSNAANATIDILDLYEGDDPFDRRQLKDPSAWMDQALPL